MAFIEAGKSSLCRASGRPSAISMLPRWLL